RLFGDLGGFIGNLVYTEVGGGTTDAGIAGEVSIDGGPGSTVSFLLTRTSTGPFTGYYSDARTAPSGDFSSLSFGSGTLTLTADASTSQFAAIAAQPQNELRVSFNVAAVPEPATWLMFLSGVGVLGLIAYRRL
ncbi:MAG TPA: PEP-CTERM sorting domain-containing protein, partial [Rhodocyclaceae bacterium]|nr:PEP-CTERM sorting domain-containing protein [Rhodocyclaceae bacterium]